MRVAFDSEAVARPVYGGVPRYVVDLALALHRHTDVEVKLFAPLYRNAYSAELPRAVVSGLRIPVVRGTASIVSVVSRRVAQWQMRRYQPDIVHRSYYGPEAGRVRAPTVVTVHDMMAERGLVSISPREVCERRENIRTADAIICVSNTTRDDLLSYYNVPESRVFTVYPGVRALGGVSPEVQQKSNRPYILYVGKRSGYKNFERLVRAFAASTGLRAECDIVCFGGGPFAASELELIQKTGVAGLVHRANGGDHALQGAYQAATCLVYPSIYEGFGIPPLEAMKLGCPVVASSAGPMPEVLGDAAIYCEPTSVTSIKEALEKVVFSSSVAANAADAGAKRAAAYSWERTAHETHGVYKLLASGGVQARSC